MKEALKHNWQLFFLFIVAILIPTNKDVIPIIILWLITWIYMKEYKNLKVSLWLGVTVLFFLFHALSILFSDNKSIAFNQVTNRLYFLLLPPLISTCRIDKHQFRNIMMLYIFSCAAVSLFLLLRAFYYCFSEGAPIYTYSQFSFFLHPSYISMFLVWALFLFLKFDFKLAEKSPPNYLAKYSIIMLFIASILLCSSKIGMLTLVITFLLMGFHLLPKIRFTRYLMASFLAVFSFGCILINEVPQPLVRLKNAMSVISKINGDKNVLRVNKMFKDEESTIMRILIWNASKTIIADNFFIGTGTGDVQAHLLKEYKARRIDAAFAHKLNAHNQFVETQLGLGLAGLIPLLTLTFGLLGFGIYKKDLLLSAFAGLISLNFLVESMFEWQIACIFFTFFLFLLLKNNELQENEV